LAVSGSTIFAGTFRGVFSSNDNGTNWTKVDSGLTNPDVWALAVSGRNIFAGNGNGISISTDNGTSWKAVNSGLSNLGVYSLAVSQSDIFAGTWGSGVWRRPLSDFAGTIDRPARRLSNYTTFKIFSPGAEGSKATIVFFLTHRERVNFTIYNLSGYVIRSLADKQFESGPQTLFWDTRSLAPGCYMVKMQAEANTCVKNFMLTR
jgi:hypothetical protein